LVEAAEGRLSNLFAGFPRTEVLAAGPQDMASVTARQYCSGGIKRVFVS